MNVLKIKWNFVVFLFFLLTALTVNCVRAQNVTLDYFFNHEVHTVNGKSERFHYLWEETGNNGFSIWGAQFTNLGAQLKSLDAHPTGKNLKNTDVYIIVDPDNQKENTDPNYITQEDVNSIAKWVKSGGVLVLMANDSANVGLPHFNKLAEKFGLHFNNDLQLHVRTDVDFEDGAIELKNHQIFKTARKVFLKDVCSLTISGDWKPCLKAGNGAVIAATTHVGKGMIFAVGDPWLYNEYVNGRLPAGYENDKAAADLARWLLDQTI
jgi:hypothetical protein